ncbi:MAG: hypothetical protein HN696_05635, partial [Euryarchaeota archaeon]|nr:hypothetical protein [Euryarchaeota archaeon]
MVELEVLEQADSKPPGSYPFDETRHGWIGKKWVSARISNWTDIDDKIEVSCSWEDGNKGLLGIWIPVTDQKHQSNRPESALHQSYSDNLGVSIGEWKFGNSASVEI